MLLLALAEQEYPILARSMVLAVFLLKDADEDGDGEWYKFRKHE